MPVGSLRVARWCDWSTKTVNAAVALSQTDFSSLGEERGDGKGGEFAPPFRCQTEELPPLPIPPHFPMVAAPRPQGRRIVKQDRRARDGLGERLKSGARRNRGARLGWVRRMPSPGVEPPCRPASSGAAGRRNGGATV